MKGKLYDGDKGNILFSIIFLVFSAVAFLLYFYMWELFLLVIGFGFLFLMIPLVIPSEYLDEVGEMKSKTMIFLYAVFGILLISSILFGITFFIRNSLLLFILIIGYLTFPFYGELLRKKLIKKIPKISVGEKE